MAKAVREAFGKGMLATSLRNLASESSSAKDLSFPVKSVVVTPKTDFVGLARANPWLETEVRGWK